MKGVRGILTWFHGDVPAPDEYLTWAASVLDSGKKLVVLAELGVSADTPGVSSVDVNAIWTRLGLESDGQWVRMTYDLEVVHGDPELVGFERSLGGILPSYPVMRTSGESAHAHLVVARPGSEGTESALVVVSEGGGFIAPGYALYAPRPELVQWRVNPFEFFRRAFSTDELPKPDTTTISGRRIFYSHIDGDGWRNGSEIPAYVEERAYASEVILREVLERFDDLPVSVAPVVGDLDPDWYGDATTLRIAREIFALPHVEAGSHTYSHPLDWGYFDPDDPAARGRTPKKNHRATDRDWRRHEWLRSVIGWMESSGLVTVREPTKTVADAVDGLYDRRRSNELEPFDLSKEIAGSVEFIRRLLPPGKDVAIVQWSGNTKPFPEAIASVRRLGLRNINGGDSRLDVEFPSYAWVAPLGIRVGRELQVFASNSNENTYTDSLDGPLLRIQAPSENDREHREPDSHQTLQRLLPHVLWRKAREPERRAREHARRPTNRARPGDDEPLCVHGRRILFGEDRASRPAQVAHRGARRRRDTAVRSRRIPRRRLGQISGSHRPTPLPGEPIRRSGWSGVRARRRTRGARFESRAGSAVSHRGALARPFRSSARETAFPLPHRGTGAATCPGTSPRRDCTRSPSSAKGKSGGRGSRVTAHERWISMAAPPRSCPCT